MQNNSYEKSSRREINRSRVIGYALRCFVEKGIEASTMTDIAQRAGVTERSVYRYFDTKADLVLETALLFWKQAMEQAEGSEWKELCSALSGLEQIRRILYGYANLFLTNRQEMIFVHEAEGYLSRCRKSQLLGGTPPTAFGDSTGPLALAIRKGMEDGTVRSDGDIESLYYNTYDALLGLIQKLAIGGAHSEQYDRMACGRLYQFCDLLVDAYQNK